MSQPDYRTLPPIVHYNLETGWRGGERQVLLLMRELAAGGASQRLVCRRGGALADRVRQAGIPCELTEVRGRLAGWLSGRDLRQPAIHHAHTGSAIPLALNGAGRSSGVSVATRRVRLPLKSKLIFRSDALVAVSRAVADDLRAAARHSVDIHVIGDAYDPLSVTATPAAHARRQLRLPQDIPIGVTTAALTPEKRPELLIRALSRISRPYLHVWLGDGPMLKQVRGLAERSGVTDLLRLVGFVEDVHPWLDAADLYIQPSRSEGFGSSLLDAIAHGLPIVVASDAGIDWLADGCAVVADPKPDAVAAAVNALLREPEQAHRLAERARALLTGREAAAMAAAYAGVYVALADAGQWRR